METVEEVVAPPPCHNNDLSPVAKGKRTKRQRPHSPIPFTVINNDNRLSPSFSAITTEEEEDTARCLILLSRGAFLHNHRLANDHFDHEQYNRRTQTAIAASDKGGGMYACKTCNRVFSSFQALGGHRTSHKKPKNDKNSTPFPDFDDYSPSTSSKKKIPPSLSLQLSNTTTSAAGGAKQLSYPRIHECSYCGAEFNSGQALGGHMRRHRAGPTSPLPSPAYGGAAEAIPPEPKKTRNGLSLDLNFPAAEDENQRFGMGGRRREKSPEKLVISATTPTLVSATINLRRFNYFLEQKSIIPYFTMDNSRNAPFYEKL